MIFLAPGIYKDVYMGFLTPASILELPTRNHFQGSRRVTFAMVDADGKIDLVVTAKVGALEQSLQAKSNDFCCGLITPQNFLVDSHYRVHILKTKRLSNLELCTEDTQADLGSKAATWLLHLCLVHVGV